VENQVRKDVHRVGHLKIFSRLLRVFTFLITANNEHSTGQKEIMSTRLSHNRNIPWCSNETNSGS